MPRTLNDYTDIFLLILTLLALLTLLGLSRNQFAMATPRVVHACSDIGVGITRCSFFLANKVPLRWSEALPLLRGDDGGTFCTALTETLQEFPHPAFFFEATPVTRSKEEAFEFVLVRSPQSV